ncbi:MAG: GAF domain-containing protein, partial [Verrucomicrobiaceae bacterium]
MSLPPESSQTDHTASSDPRQTALEATALLDTPPEAAFDRITRLVSELLNAPVALVSLVDSKRQFFKSSCGLAEPWASKRQTPLSHSFCQHVAASGTPLVITDAREHPLVLENLAIRDLKVIAYLGMPIKTPTGHTLGSLCAIDHVPRQWTEQEQSRLADLAEVVMSEIEIR